MTYPNTSTVSARVLKEWLSLRANAEIALIDVREHGQFGEGHLYFAVSIPYSKLEFEIRKLVPRKSTTIVLYDNADDVAFKSMKRLRALGYSNVFFLEGGVNSWARAGYALFSGVNVPSKTFGEYVEGALATPSISPAELKLKIEKNENIIILDGRPYPEYQQMNIPGAHSCPNSELPLYIDTFIKDKNTEIIINCAGRTRSIIGAQTLINLGIENKVFALENGTQGWYLNDYQLNHNSVCNCLKKTKLTKSQLSMASDRASKLSREIGIECISLKELDELKLQKERTTFIFDIRSEEEYKSGTLKGARHALGVQLIQATDLYVGVLGARVVLFDNSENIRALVTASWLKQMGWEVAVLNEKPQRLVKPEQEACEQFKKSKKLGNLIDTDKLIAITSKCDSYEIIDVRPSQDFRKIHFKGAIWSIRPNLQGLIKRMSPISGTKIIVVASQADIGKLALLEISEIYVQEKVFLYVVNEEDWNNMPLKIGASRNYPVDSECIDFLFFVHDRHKGNKTSAKKYLEWETGLLKQIDEQVVDRFKVLNRGIGPG